ncbi:uncharacterized protein LOC111891159 [Lactuca sativa]|uniref:uncharacterized protein LOC111891159 n=1 Tax=Lactuca sativa TaxID=4236 RepID=UPI000CD8B8F8|nr:uncharacterized protein LOC111891159 [Lactuca sativa]
MGDSSMVDYCNHVKSLADLMENMDAKVSEINLFSYMLNGLSAKYRHMATTIRHQRPVPSFWDTRSMLVLEDQQLSQDQNLSSLASHFDDSSSPTVLTADSTHPNTNRAGFRGGTGGQNHRGGHNGGRNSGHQNDSRQQQHQRNF